MCHLTLTQRPALTYHGTCTRGTSRTRTYPRPACGLICSMCSCDFFPAPPSTIRRFTELGQLVYSPPGKQRKRFPLGILDFSANNVTTQHRHLRHRRKSTQCPVAPYTRPPRHTNERLASKGGTGTKPCLEQETTGAPSQPSTPACSSAEVAHVRRAKHLSNGVNRGRQQDGGRLPEKNVYRNRDARGSYPAPDGRIGTCACGDWLEQRLEQATFRHQPPFLFACCPLVRTRRTNTYIGLYT